MSETTKEFTPPDERTVVKYVIYASAPETDGGKWFKYFTCDTPNRAEQTVHRFADVRKRWSFVVVERIAVTTFGKPRMLQRGRP